MAAPTDKLHPPQTSFIPWPPERSALLAFARANFLIATEPFDAVLRIERRVSHEGCVSVGGNYYSVPDGTRKRILDVETTPDTIRIFEDGALIATHARLEGRRERSILAGHRLLQRIMQREKPDGIVLPPGHAVAQRPLAVYDFIGRQIGGQR